MFFFYKKKENLSSSITISSLCLCLSFKTVDNRMKKYCLLEENVKTVHDGQWTTFETSRNCKLTTLLCFTIFNYRKMF